MIPSNKLYSKEENFQRKSGAVPSSDKARSDFRRDFGRVIHSPSFRRLQNKTQVFPYFESDYFRTRLTHSLEVAQIAKGIALGLNHREEFFKENNIDTDLIETICLCHDIGHPAFGHTGEEALDECMKDYGGFESNAQTLRIITKLEKKRREGKDEIDDKGNDCRLGLDLTYRTLAGVLKYDREIPYKYKDRKYPKDVPEMVKGYKGLHKGYYEDESEIVAEIKKKILPGSKTGKQLKTIECSIMDLADDIAYSTYDLEDTLKASFLDVLDCLALDDDKPIIKKLYNKFNKKYKKSEIIASIIGIFVGTLEPIKKAIKDMLDKKKSASPTEVVRFLIKGHEVNRLICEDGFIRTQFTSALVNEFMGNIELVKKTEDGKDLPCELWEVRFNRKTEVKVKVLKNLVFENIISNSRLQLPEFREKDIIREIFITLSSPEGEILLPGDHCKLLDKHDQYLSISKKPDDEVAFLREKFKFRLISDFIASMTDRYVLEFYGRLKSENPETIFKPIY